MNNFFRAARSILCNLGIFLLMYYAVEGNSGAKNVLLFIVGFMFFGVVVLCLGHNSKEVKELRDKGRPIPAFVSHSIGIFFIFYMVYYGWWFTGLALLFIEMAEHSIYKKEEI